MFNNISSSYRNPRFGMKRCAIRRSSALRCRHYSAAVNPELTPRNGASEPRRQDASSEELSEGIPVRRVESGDIVKFVGTLRPHKVMSEPRSARKLPLSPLMDSTWLASTQKHKLPKAPPSPTSTMTEMQKQLANNPYAQMLSSPLRACKTTGITLPRYFLQDFELVEHPETKDPWWMPRSLATKSRRAEAQLLETHSQRDLDEDVDPDADPYRSDEFDDSDLDPEPASFAEESEHAPAEELEPNTSSGQSSTSPIRETASTSVSTTSSPHSPPISRPNENPFRPQTIGPRVYTLARYHLLTLFKKFKWQTNVPKYHSAWKGFLSRRLFNVGGRLSPSNLNWREDMEDHMLELMRRRTVEQLDMLASLRKGYLTYPKESEIAWQQVAKMHQPAAVLWLGPTRQVLDARKESRETVVPREVRVQMRDGVATTVEVEKEFEERVVVVEGPPYWATLDRPAPQKVSKIPVYNLRRLLGDLHVQRLREMHPVLFGREIVVLKHKKTTFHAQLWLWKLMGYLYAPPRESWEVSEEVQRMIYESEMEEEVKSEMARRGIVEQRGRGREGKPAQGKGRELNNKSKKHDGHRPAGTGASF